MNRKRKIVLFVVALMVLCFMGCGKNEENPYGATVSGLGDNDAYALLEMDYQYNVLVTSDMLYDEGNEKQAATEQEYLALTEEYSKSQIIHFAYGASNCVNEFTNFDVS